MDTASAPLTVALAFLVYSAPEAEHVNIGLTKMILQDGRVAIDNRGARQ